MKKDNTEDQYKKITQELKEEKMNWDFEDFLKKAEENEKIIPLVQKSKGGSFPKNFLMAASIILLIAIAVFFNYDRKSTLNVEDNLAENIQKTKDSLNKEFNLAQNVASDTLKTKSEIKTNDSTSTVEKNESEIMDQILPKRGRIKKFTRERYAQAETPKKNTPKNKIETSDYESNYVIINGQKIENEQEAIDLTKYSFQILSENVSKTMAQTDALNSLTNDY